MKYLPLLVLGLLATPAFADDVNVKATAIPNLYAPVGPYDVACLYLNGHNACRLEKRHVDGLILVDDVNVPVKPLANETAIPGTVAVWLNCAVQPDASLNDCRLADGATASRRDQDEAIGFITTRGHVAGAFVSGGRETLKVTLNVGHAPSLLPIR